MKSQLLAFICLSVATVWAQHCPSNKVECTLSDTPCDKELSQYINIGEPLLPCGAETVSDASENQALASALNTHARRTNTEDFSSLTDFCTAYPDSAWRPSLELNRGLALYKLGYFSQAMIAFEAAWNLTKDCEHPNSVLIANRSGAELALMKARVGEKEVVESFIATLSERNLQGAAKIRYESAREGLWAMINRPGVSFRCGAYALYNLFQDLGGTGDAEKYLANAMSPSVGFSLWELKGHAAEQLGMEVTLGKRPVGGQISIPSVVHWKVGHYGALVAENNDHYLLKDPTFGEAFWISKAAIDAEASGYMVVGGDTLPQGWETITQQQAESVYGKGHSGNSDPDETKDCGTHTTGQGGADCAMAQYEFHTMLTSLSVYDTPVGYTPAVGPSVFFKVRYNQKEADQPTSMNFTNFSPQWTSYWVAYLEENPANIGGTVTVHLQGGGREIHNSFDSATQSYTRHRLGEVIVKRVGDGHYERRFADGSKEVYAHAIGTTGPDRKVYLSQKIDPQGNAVTLNYDTTTGFETRLIGVTDALGQQTALSYEHPSKEYLVTKVTDPFGRFASFDYELIYGDFRLKKITDVVSIESSFEYNQHGEITSFTTPYGTTHFEFAAPNQAYGLIRWLKATDPHGDSEMLEYTLQGQITGVTSSIPSIAQRPSGSGLQTIASDADDRNTFYWDKQAMKYHEGDYSKAHLYHWAQVDGADKASGVLEAEKPALTQRIWYNYPGQNSAWNMGTSRKPIRVGRLIEDDAGGTISQISLMEYNGLSRLTKSVDPLGRETVIEYDTNQIDVLKVTQKVVDEYHVLQQYVYDPAFPAHLPKDVYDAAGNKTRFTYTTEGQVKSVTNALNETTIYHYQNDPAINGYLKVSSIENNEGRTQATFHYDSAQRISSITDESNHTVTFQYDNLDRVTRVTFPDGSYEESTYEHLNLKTFRDRKGKITTYFFDRLRRPTIVQDYLGRKTQFEWCRCGDIRKIIDGKGNVTHWKRDVMGRVEKKIMADGREYAMSYEPLSGRLSSFTDPKGQVATMLYNVDDTLKSNTYTNTAVATATESFSYDPDINRLTSVTDGIGTTAYTYHPGSVDPVTIPALGAFLTHEVDGPFTGASDKQTYTYDQLGRLKTHNIGSTGTENRTVYGFDSLQRASSITNNLGDFSMHYVGDSGRLDYVDYPNTMRVDFDYKQVGEDHLLSQINNLADRNDPASVISQFDYGYSQERLINSWVQSQSGQTSETWAMRYDRANQLKSVVATETSNPSNKLKHYAYSFDKSGNRTSKQVDLLIQSAAHNPRNQLTSTAGGGDVEIRGHLDKAAKVTVNGVNAEVDTAHNFTASVPLNTGNNTLTIEATDFDDNVSQKQYSLNVTGGVAQSFEYDFNGNMLADAERSYTWDAKNRIKTITHGSDVYSFDYDFKDRRVRESLNGTPIKQFIWCGSKVCEVRNASGAVQTRYYPQGEERSGTSFYAFHDHLGSLRELTDSTGSIQAQYAYSPYGVRTKLAGSLDTNTGYTGHYTHESGVVLTHYRGYTPELGRWISPDLLGEMGPDGVNIYKYVHNNPINYIDQNGLWTVTLTAGFGLGGSIEFGFNGGNFSLKVGIGQAAGGSLSFDPNDSGNCPGDPEPPRVSLGMAGELAAGSGLGPAASAGAEVGGFVGSSYDGWDDSGIYSELTGSMGLNTPFGNIGKSAKIRGEIGGKTPGLGDPCIFTKPIYTFGASEFFGAKLGINKL